MAPNHLVTKLLIFLTLGLILMGAPRRTVAQVHKSCPEGVTLKASAGMAAQGSLILTEVLLPKAATSKFSSQWDGHDVPLWREGPTSGALHGLLGIDLEKAPGTYEWTVSWLGASGEAESCAVTIIVRAGKFPTERLKVDPQFVQPNPEQEKQAEEDSKKIHAIYDTVTPERLWQGKFRLPLKNVTTGGNFGRRRVLNGEARSPHSGVDFPAAAGTAVFASQSGKVVLAEGLYYSGNTVVIDHGYGIYTMYAHLSKIGVQAGQMVKAGEELGKVGATGRVTGPHLHWGLTINHARVNAMQIAQRQP
ncbi:MAG TPA: M23 family metallopeptidase [Candidatus Sulfotelmatobacter sp.]|nr:M23 family metallopeptidase [Candidatus Sulfotelmatobacter sp.]